jgi:hypothetical protein
LGTASAADGSKNGFITMNTDGTAKVINEQPMFGYDIDFEFQPTTAELILWRVLPMEGQVVLISQYKRLCDRKWVGAALNPTADWWYKCDNDYNYTRNANGLYMRVQDKRGVFSRTYGVNSKYTTSYPAAGGTPYDGKQVGSYLNDTIVNITGTLNGIVTNGGGNTGVFANWGPSSANIGSGQSWMTFNYALDLANIGYRTSNEIRPASTSVWTGIAY